MRLWRNLFGKRRPLRSWTVPPRMAEDIPMPACRGMLVDLGTREGYDIACGLRGPDLSLILDNADLTDLAYHLKFVFTARIRTLAGVQTGGIVRYGRVPDESAAKILALAEHLRAEGNQGARDAALHYLQHVVSAAGALGDHELAELAVILCHNVGQRTPLFGYDDMLYPHALLVEDVVRMAGGDPAFEEPTFI